MLTYLYCLYCCTVAFPGTWNEISRTYRPAKMRTWLGLHADGLFWSSCEDPKYFLNAFVPCGHTCCWCAPVVAVLEHHGQSNVLGFVKFGACIDYIQDADAPLPEKETKTTMSYYTLQDGQLFISSLPGHLRKRSTFRDQLVIPETLVGLIMHAYHDHVLSGGHIAFRPTYDKTRQKYWWPTISRDVRGWCEQCQVCQQRKTAHNKPKLPTGHLPV